MFVSIEGNEYCGVTGSAFLYSRHLVPEYNSGKCGLRDVIETFALIEVSLHYSSVNEIWEEPQITSICSSAYPLTFFLLCTPQVEVFSLHLWS